MTYESWQHNQNRIRYFRTFSAIIISTGCFEHLYNNSRKNDNLFTLTRSKRRGPLVISINRFRSMCRNSKTKNNLLSASSTSSRRTTAGWRSSRSTEISRSAVDGTPSGSLQNTRPPPSYSTFYIPVNTRASFWADIMLTSGVTFWR